MVNGLARKSTAPCRSADTAVSTLGEPVTTIALASGCCFRSAREQFRPVAVRQIQIDDQQIDGLVSMTWPASATFVAEVEAGIRRFGSRASVDQLDDVELVVHDQDAGAKRIVACLRRLSNRRHALSRAVQATRLNIWKHHWAVAAFESLVATGISAGGGQKDQRPAFPGPAGSPAASIHRWIPPSAAPWATPSRAVGRPACC